MRSSRHRLEFTILRVFFVCCFQKAKKKKKNIKLYQGDSRYGMKFESAMRKRPLNVDSEFPC